MTHLKEEVYYNDLYDSITVECCRSIEDSILNKDLSEYKVDGATEKDKKHAKYVVHQLMLYYEAGERYLQKAETIREWMERDRLKDEKLETAIAPKGVMCLKCKSQMIVSTKHFDERQGEDHILFSMTVRTNVYHDALCTTIIRNI